MSVVLVKRFSNLINAGVSNFVNGYMDEALVRGATNFINGFFVKRGF